ncbi:MAG: ATP-binding cassette domain-containing protein, partial [Alphaproteobacteria bacterium]|nr:ATP-binding cassette domain-containing protein [Alphaproteobacteria bacterium]
MSLTVESGTILGIIGKSGAGKSTLLRCLNGLETPDDGHIFFWGNDLTQMTDDALCQVRQKIGFIFQSFNLLSRRTVFENVALPLELLGLDAAEYQQRITKTLDRVGLYSKRDSYPSQLSGGQRQRVAIARALVTESQLLLCDEF